MSVPQTVNGLMRHLRNDCNIQIKGSLQKQQLVSYRYPYFMWNYSLLQATQINIQGFSRDLLLKKVKSPVIFLMESKQH